MLKIVAKVPVFYKADLEADLEADPSPSPQRVAAGFHFAPLNCFSQCQ